MVWGGSELVAQVDQVGMEGEPSTCVPIEQHLNLTTKKQHELSQVVATHSTATFPSILYTFFITKVIFFKSVFHLKCLASDRQRFFWGVTQRLHWRFFFEKSVRAALIGSKWWKNLHGILNFFIFAKKETAHHPIVQSCPNNPPLFLKALFWSTNTKLI